MNYIPVTTLIAGGSLPISSINGLDSALAAKADTSTLGSAAACNAGTGANQLVQLDANGKLPAVDGSQLTNVSGGGAGYDGFSTSNDGQGTNFYWMIGSRPGQTILYLAPNDGSGNMDHGASIRGTVSGQFSICVYSDANAQGEQDILHGDSGGVGVNGAFSATGDISCGGTKNFRIPHPIDSTRALVFAASEGPQPYLLFSGCASLINGNATVDIDAACGIQPGTFAAIVAEGSARVAGALVEGSFERIAATLTGSTLQFESEIPTSNKTVSWSVLAVRNIPFCAEPGTAALA